MPDVIVMGFYSAIKIGGIVVGVYFAIRLFKKIIE